VDVTLDDISRIDRQKSSGASYVGKVSGFEEGTRKPESKNSEGNRFIMNSHL
jgi:hypothetical protein